MKFVDDDDDDVISNVNTIKHYFADDWQKCGVFIAEEYNYKMSFKTVRLPRESATHRTSQNTAINILYSEQLKSHSVPAVCTRNGQNIPAAVT